MEYMGKQSPELKQREKVQGQLIFFHYHSISLWIARNNLCLVSEQIHSFACAETYLNQLCCLELLVSNT